MRPPPSKSTRWQVVALIACAVVMTACEITDPPAGSGRPGNAENRAEMRRVVEQARALPDVLDAEGGWVANITTYGQTGLSATVPVGTPPARAEVLADELMALMWRSRIDPINDMGATVTAPGADPSQPPSRFASSRPARHSADWPSSWARDPRAEPSQRFRWRAVGAGSPHHP